MREAPDNSDNIIDSRDIDSRIDELESERDDYEPESVDDGDEVTTEDWAAANPDDAEELESLKSFRDELEGYCDWAHGATLIRDSYFEDYARELAEDIGAIERDMAWPANCIDWERAARELQQDYTSGDFDGVTYWVR